MDSSLKRQAVFLLLLHLAFCWTGEEHYIVKTVGENCELPCFGPDGPELMVLEWTKEDKEVLLFREERVLVRDDDPEFTDRIDLLDPQLHGGDLTLVLKDISLHDSGVYQCTAVYTDGQNVSSYVDLTVVDLDGPQRKTPDPEPTSFTEILLGLKCGLIILLVIIIIIRCVIKRKMRKTTNPDSNTHCEAPGEGEIPLEEDHASQFEKQDSVCSDSSVTFLVQPEKSSC